MKNPFFKAHISGVYEFAAPERGNVEFLSRIEGSFRIEDKALLWPFWRPSSIPCGPRADASVRTNEDVVPLTPYGFLFGQSF
jgi:hypothetical protein